MAFDYKKEYKEFYMPKDTPAIVTVPKMNYMFCTVLCVSVRFRTTESRPCMVPHAAFMTLTLPSSL